MKRWFFPLMMLVASVAIAQVPVTFKVFPRDYEVFSNGQRLTWTERPDGNRVYSLPAGTQRISLSAAETLPLSLSVNVKAGMPMVQAKLEPRNSLLSLSGEAKTGRGPRSLAFSADGKALVVALAREAFLEIYEVPSLKMLGKMAPTSGTGGFTDVMMVAEKNEIWALQTDGNLQIFDAQKYTWKENVGVTGGGNAFFLPAKSGRTGFYNADLGTVVALDTSTRKVVGRLFVGDSPRGAGSDGTTLWVTQFDAGRVALIDLATWKLKETWAAGKAPRPVAVVGEVLYVGDMGSARVLAYPVKGKTPLRSLAVGSNPHAMVSSPDGAWAALATRGKNNPQDYQLPGPEFGKVTLLDAKGTVAASVWGRNQPTGLAFSPDSRWLAFTDLLDDNLELYRLR